MPKFVFSRGTTVKFKDLPDNSIALDGYVQGPAIDAGRRRFSFDHHSECIRMVTAATCEQVWTALKAGERPKRRRGRPPKNPKAPPAPVPAGRADEP